MTASVPILPVAPGRFSTMKRLAEALGQPLTDQAREDVRRAAPGKADDDAHRPRRIGLRPSDARDGRQHGSARCQM
jgi:hypothetical protein